jgi:hypothetical protein
VRKSKTSLCLPAPIGASHLNLREESDSSNKRGKWPAEVEPPVPWFPADLEGLLLEMEGRPAGEGLVMGKLEAMAMF